MPCDAVRVIGLELKVANPDVLTRGIKAIGYEITHLSGGAMRVRTPQGSVIISDGMIKGDENVVARVAGEVKRAYAAEAVRTAARKFGWSVVNDKQVADHMTILKR